MEKPDLLILGAADEGRMALAILRARGEDACVRGFIEVCGNKALLGVVLDGVPVVAPIEELPSLAAQGCRRAVTAMGDGATRQRLARAADDARMDIVTLIHPSAILAPTAEIGRGSILHAGCIIEPAAHLGMCVIVNTGATVNHDVVLGDFTTIAPGAHLAGYVTVGDGATIGIGACVINCIRIGPGAFVAAGAAVVSSIPPGALVGGVPARPLARNQ